MQKKIRCELVLFWEVTCLDNRPSIIFIGWNLVINLLLKGVLHMVLPRGFLVSVLHIWNQNNFYHPPRTVELQSKNLCFLDIFKQEQNIQEMASWKIERTKDPLVNFQYFKNQYFAFTVAQKFFCDDRAQFAVAIIFFSSERKSQSA